LSLRNAPKRDHDFRLAGLLEARRWLILLLLTEAWLFAAIVGAAQWRELSGADRLILIIAVLCIISGWLLSRRTVGLWLVTLAPILLVIAAAVGGSDSNSAKWIALSVSCGHVAYALIMLTPPAFGLIAIGASGTALMIIWSRTPTNVFPGPLAIAGGWLSFTTILVSGLALWWAWTRLTRYARISDLALERLNRRLDAEIETQERSRMWRAAAASVHESLLSTLRYILQTESLDRAGLAATSARASSVSATISSEDLRISVQQATAARLATDIVQLDPSAIDLPISDEARLATRAAIVECALNAVLHGRASAVVVSAERIGRMWEIRISDNGTGLAPDVTPGLGWALVLDAGLTEVGGTWRVSSNELGTDVYLSVPEDLQHSLGGVNDDGFNQGRLLISAPLAAVGVVGIACEGLAAWGTVTGWPMAVVGATAAITALAIVAQAARTNAVIVKATLLALGLVPLLMVPLAGDIATRGAVLIAGLTAAGYSLLSVAVWSPSWHWISALALWAIGAIIFGALAGSGTGNLILVSLVNCLVIVPIVFIVTSIGSRRFQRAQIALMLNREAMRRQVIRASAATLIDRHLTACVAQAQAIVSDLASGAQLDEETRHRIECLEGLIRSTIQMDPVTSGEFTRATARLVNTAFNASVPAYVGTLISSRDTDPLPAEFLTLLESLVVQCTHIRVRSFQIGNSDYLSLELQGLHQGLTSDVANLFSRPFHNVEVEVETVGQDNVIVMVTRQMSLQTVT
jgi:hypothetical protein